ncbi:hypothetical protein [Amphibiibacter pelophylacis]|uniref:Uncharacterized protein n=1 Tax=Amphibiibacter pelophylacis TaxID=1799477 RepID=A0ACC6P401_9BURK
MNPTPISYLPSGEREALLREGGMNLVYLAESQEAGRAGDEDSAWAWLCFAELTAQSLLGLKRRAGAQFIREKGLNTASADTAFGEGWLDRA